MKSFTPQVTQFLSSLTLIGGILVIFMVSNLILMRLFKITDLPLQKRLTRLLQNHGLLFAWIVAAIAMSGSLFYSDIAGYKPCILCWYQRILMYPQVFILGLALIRKKKDVIPYALILAIPGLLIASFHYFEQITNNPLIPCTTIGYSVSCTEKFFFSYGYITIPMMALTAFAMIILFLTYAQKKS
ncbi:MAG: disulfide bond formation protein B [Candidatus Roizmanbacteria bacterium]